MEAPVRGRGMMAETIACAVAALVLLGSCAGAPPQPSGADPQTPGVAVPAGTGTTTPGSEPALASNPAGDQPTINIAGPPEPGAPGANAAGQPAWVPPGPADPNDPPPDGWYGNLVLKQCDSMAGGDALGTAARDLCTAVTTGEQNAWDQVDTDYAALPQPDGSSCLETAAYQVLANLVQYHRAHPGAKVATQPGANTACPLALSGILDVAQDATALNPHVPAEGGTVLRLRGRFLAVSAVLVNGQTVAASKNAENNYDFVAPPSSAAGPVTVQAVAPDGSVLTGSAEYTYDPAEVPAAPATTTEPEPPASNPADAPTESVSP